MLDTIVAPAGLDIGARSPEEIALSVMAQIVERRRRGAGKEADSAASSGDARREAIDPVCGMTVAIAGHVTPQRSTAHFLFCCDVVARCFSPIRRCTRQRNAGGGNGGNGCSVAVGGE